MEKARPAFERILLKLSGEALMGDMDYGIDPAYIRRIATEVKAVSDTGVEVAMVIGGGNIFRGAGLAEGGMDRVTGDHMGMLATVINCLSMQDALENQGAYCRVMSALPITVSIFFTSKPSIAACKAHIGSISVTVTIDPAPLNEAAVPLPTSP